MNAMAAKKQVLLFLCITLLLSWAYELLLTKYGGVKNFGILGLVALMWIPGSVSLLLRLFSGIGFSDVGFARGQLKYYFSAIGIPLVLGLLVNFLCAFFDIRHFAPLQVEKLEQLLPLVSMNLGIGLLGALGEELGWRGFLLPKMIATEFPAPYLSSGIIWALWLLPIIGFGSYYASNQVLLLCSTYAASIIAMNFVISELRVRSGSVWVATAFHGAHNFFLQLVFPFLLFTKPGARADLWEIWGADCGFLVAILYLAVFFLFMRGKYAAKMGNAI